MSNKITYDEPEKLSLREWYVEQNKTNVYIEDIEELTYDFYGAPIFEIEGEEYAVIPASDIEYVFHQYADSIIDDVVIPELPENLRGYFDYEKFERDMSFDGYGQMSNYDGECNEYFLNDEEGCYYILRMN